MNLIPGNLLSTTLCTLSLSLSRTLSIYLCPPVVVDYDGRACDAVGGGLDEAGGAGHELEVGLADVHSHLAHLRVPAAEHVA